MSTATPRSVLATQRTRRDWCPPVCPCGKPVWETMREHGQHVLGDAGTYTGNWRVRCADVCRCGRLAVLTVSADLCPRRLWTFHKARRQPRALPRQRKEYR